MTKEQKSKLISNWYFFYKGDRELWCACLMENMESYHRGESKELEYLTATSIDILLDYITSSEDTNKLIN